MDNYILEAPCLFFQATENNLVTGFNNTFLEATGFTHTELEGAKTDLFFTVSTKIFQQTHLFPLLKMQDHVEEIFISLRSKSGTELPVLINASRKEIDGVNQILYCGLIVRNRKKFEEELIAAKNQIQKALIENTELLETKTSLQKRTEELDRQLLLIQNQNQILVQFNKVISHDMQEPMRKIRIYSDMLKSMEEKEKINYTLSKIEASVAVMYSQMQKLQQFLWLSDATPRKEKITPALLIDQVCEQLQKEYPATAYSIQLSLTTDLFGDAKQLELMLYHIIGNSLRFSNRENINISISTYTLKLNKFQELENKYKYIDYVRLEIKDNGPGFNPQYVNDVFNLFSRLHLEKGSGTGLTFCKKIADLHNGFINIETKEGEGTLLIVDLPLEE